ncbi:E3 ubiquitin-protein ligase TRIM45-like [Oculina patagonica]
MESLLKNLKQHLTCSICLDIYNEPKTISCLHTFCCECLSNHARASHRQGKFRCPECQALIDLPEGNRFKSLPSSFFHNSLLSLLAVRRSGDGSNITCSQCRKTNSQMYYCFDCGQFLCPDCNNAHDMLKASFAGHKVTPVKEFKEEDYEALLKRQLFGSQQFHEKEITRFFCFSCQDCVCQICIVTDHRNHEIILLDKAAHDEKTNIMSGAEMIEEKISELGEVIRKFEDTFSQLENNVGTAKRGVSQAAEQMIAKIREREREAIVLLETTRVTRLERIDSAMQDAQSLVKQMKQAVEFAKNLAERSSSSDVMRNKETLKQRFEMLRAVDVPKHNETTFVQFTPASVDDLKLGLIETTDKYRAEANRSTLEGLDQILQAGVEAEFTLCLKTSEGELSNQADLKDQVEVLIDPAKDVTNVMVSEKEDGNLQLKFSLQVPGAYSIEVKINGDKLPTSPFTMEVKERELVVVGELDLKFNQGDVPQRLHGIAVNREDKIAVTDNHGHCVYVFDKDGNCLRKIGKQGSASGQFQHPTGVVFLNDNEILIADQLNHRIQHINIQTGTVVKSFGKCGAGKGEFKNPLDVCLDDEGRIVVTDCSNHRIHVLSKEGETISIFGDSGPEKLNNPRSCIAYKNMFLVSDTDNNCIKAYDQSGSFMYKFGTQGNQDGQYNLPYGMLVDTSDNILVCDYKNMRVQQFSLDGRFTGKTLTHLPNPVGIATAPDGRILVTSYTAKKVYILK